MSETNTPPQQVLVYPQYSNQEENEINLFDLWQVIVKQKKIILATTIIVTVIAFLFAFLSAPVYRTETVFLPPAKNDIQVLNIPNISTIKTNEVYAVFRENLGSITIRKQIFDRMKLVDEFEPDRNETTNVDEVFNKFNENIKLIIPNPKKGEFTLPTTKLVLEESDPVLIAEIVNRIAKQAEEATKAELISDIKAKVDERKKQLKLEITLLLDKTKQQRLDEVERLETADALERRKIEDKIKTLKTSAKGKRLDRIVKLTEASEIAHSLGIKDPIDYKLKKISDSPTIKSQIMTDISSKAPQLYTLGYEALEAETASLKKRSDDSPFIKELRALEEKLTLLEHNRKAEQLKNRTNDAPFITELRKKESNIAFLNTINIAPDTIKPAILDRTAFPPEKRIKPKRVLIIVLGLIVGLILGVIIAVVRNFQSQYEGSKI